MGEQVENSCGQVVLLTVIDEFKYDVLVKVTKVQIDYDFL